MRAPCESSPSSSHRSRRENADSARNASSVATCSSCARTPRTVATLVRLRSAVDASQAQTNSPVSRWQDRGGRDRPGIGLRRIAIARYARRNTIGWIHRGCMKERESNDLCPREDNCRRSTAMREGSVGRAASCHFVSNCAMARSIEDVLPPSTLRRRIESSASRYHFRHAVRISAVAP
jgi:hypothetical protein